MPRFQPVDLQFPLGGVDVSLAFGQQRASAAPLGASYDRSFQQQKFETCARGVNCRGYEPLTSRMRGGSRPGLTKYLTPQVNGAAAVQGLGYTVNAGITAPGGVTQGNTSGRVVTLLAVAGGKLRVASPGGSQWVVPTNGNTNLFNATGPVQMTQGLYTGVPVVFFADGSHYFFYNPATNALNAWTMTAGGQPSNAGNTPRLCCTWRGRVVLSGIKTDPQNWFMSAAGPYVSGSGSGSGGGENFNYAPASVQSTQAVAGNNSTLGKVGDVVTGLIPINDNNLVFLCDHTVWLLRGDPMAGGSLTCVEETAGGAWGQAWCLDGEGTAYWLSNRGAVYQFSQFDYPRRISQRVDPYLMQLSVAALTPTLVWDDWLQGLHLFLTHTTNPTQATTHFFWERRTNAWWQDSFANGSHNPNCCLLFDGNLPTDHRALVGCQDGYVRFLDLGATSDDGTPVQSSVLIGPVMSGFSELMVRDLRAVLAAASGTVTWQLFADTSAEAAVADATSGTPLASGTWQGGLNRIQYVRRAGKALYLLLTASTPWAFEQVRANVAALGDVRERGSL